MAEQLLSRTDVRACYMPQNYEDLLEPDRTPVDFLSVTGDKEETTRIRTYLGSMKYTVDEMNASDVGAVWRPESKGASAEIEPVGGGCPDSG